MSDSLNLPERKNLRLAGYDYSKSGLYFITICTQNREYLFGCIENNQMILNDAGQMVDKWFRELENKYPDKKTHEFVVMPNHFHGIVENVDYTLNNHTDAHVGAPLRGRPYDSTNTNIESLKYGSENQIFGATIGRAIDWFKTMTTNKYIQGVKNNGWQRFNGKLWQRNFHDHIIRDQQDYERISDYIRNNPARWKEDRLR